MNVMWMASLTYASALILLALAFSLMYKSTNVPNFATGTLMGFGAYASYTSTKIMKLPYYFGYPVSFITGAAIAGLTCLLIIEPMIKRKRTLVEITLATLGLMVLTEALTHIFDYWIRDQLNRTYSAIMLREYVIFIGDIGLDFIVASLLVFSIYLFLRYLFRQTKWGISQKAAWENPELAQIQGVDPVRDRFLVWVLAGGLAGLSGGIMLTWFHVTAPSGAWMITPILAAVFLGGIGNIRGSFIGGLLVGVVEIFGTSWGQFLFGVWIGEYRPVISFIILSSVLLISPNGLFGSEISETSSPLSSLKKVDRRILVGVIVGLVVIGSVFSYACTVNRVKARDEVLSGFSDYDLEVMEMDREVTGFNAGNITQFKNLLVTLNVSKVYVEPYTDSTNHLTFFFIRYEKYWKSYVNLEHYGFCGYRAR